MLRQEEFLVLIADSDRHTCKLLSDFLAVNCIKSAIASDKLQAIEMVAILKPDFIILDFALPGSDGLTFVSELQAQHSGVSVIITTEHPDLKLAVQAMKDGALDYVAKPLIPGEILEKLRSTFAVSPRAVSTKKNEFTTLYSVLNKITATHDIETLFTIVFDAACSLTSASGGSLCLYDKECNELVNIRFCGECTSNKRIPITSDSKESSIVQFIYRRRASAVRDFNGQLSVSGDTTFTGWREIGVPLCVSGDVIGVVVLTCKEDGTLFSPSDLNLIDVIASQAGIAVYNANLYSSINQKLEELMLISNYSEQLMGLVDKYEVVRTLYTTTIKYFPIDMLGFLIVQKRTHEFLYWTRNSISEPQLHDICSEVVDQFNSSMSMSINEKRIRYRRMTIGDSVESLEGGSPFLFKHIIPVCWEDFKFGAFFFGSVKEVQNKSEMVTLLSSLVNQTRIALTNSKLYSDIKENYIRTIKALAIAVDAKDTYTHGHSENVMNIAESIARAMNLDEKNIGIIRDAGLLHDIGKIGIPGSVLNKPGPLTYEEFNGIMKTHSTLGANIVKDVPFLHELYKHILYHHEHFDGSGYPEGLKGEQIPLGARIIHVADAFEAMTSNRPYRTSLGEAEAIKRLTEGKSRQFDPHIIDVFLNVAKKNMK